MSTSDDKHGAPELAIDEAEHAARRDGLSVAPYRLLYDLHMKRRDFDAAWCAAAVLVLLEAATGDERAHYERFAPREATPVAAALGQDRLQSLLHENEKAQALAGGEARRTLPASDLVRHAHARAWAERVLGLAKDERGFFNPEPPTLDAEHLHAATKGVMYERALDKSANRAALVVSGSFAAVTKVSEEREALFPFAASRLHGDLRRHLGRRIDARRARTIEEMRFYASLHPCKTCGGPPRALDLHPGPDFYTLSGPCGFCGAAALFGFFVEGDPAKASARQHELGPDDRASQIVHRALLAEELDRSLKVPLTSKVFEIAPAAWHASVRAIDRVIHCSAELAKVNPKIRDHQHSTRDTFVALARQYAAAGPRIAELEGRRLSLRDEIAGLLVQIRADRLPAAADLRAYFTSRLVRATQAPLPAQAGGEIVVVLAASDVTAVRIWDDASGTHALLAVGKGTREDVGELERVVLGHRVHLRVVTLDSGALTRVSIHFALKAVETAPIGRMLAKLFDAAGPPKSVAALAEALGTTLDTSILPMGAMGSFSVPRVGAGATVTSLSVKYLWDVHHEDTVRSVEALGGRTVYEWTADFGTAITDVEAALRERFGAPREAEQGLVFGSFVVARAAPFTLSWYAVLPDGALPQPDRSVRESALRAIASVFEATAAPSAAAKIVSMIPGNAGIAHVPSSSGATLRFSPSIRAAELARILGWRDAVGQTFSVHQDRWEIRVVVGKNEYGPVTELPRIGAWSVRAHLTARPVGGTWGNPADGAGPLGGTHEFGPEDFAGSIAIEPGMSSPTPTLTPPAPSVFADLPVSKQDAAPRFTRVRSHECGAVAHAAVDVVFESATDAEPLPCAGLAIGPEDAERTLLIRPDGSFAITRTQWGTFGRLPVLLVPWTKHPRLLTGVGVVNRIALEISSAGMRASINGEIVAERAKDDKDSIAELTCLVACGGGAPSRVRFERLELTGANARPPLTGETVALDVVCTDALRYGNGRLSPPREDFRVALFAPADWVSAPFLNERVFELVCSLWEDWTTEGRARGDSTGYVLLGVRPRVVDPALATGKRLVVQGTKHETKPQTKREEFSLSQDIERSHAGWVARQRTGEGRLVLENKRVTAQTRGALLARARFVSCDLGESQMDYTDLEDSELLGCESSRFVANNSQLNRATIAGTSLAGAQLMLTYFEDAKIDDSDFSSAQLDRANFTRARIRGTKFVGAKLCDARFDSAEIRACDFRNADFSRVEIALKKLGAFFGTTFIDCDFRGASFTGRRLGQTTFEGCQLAGVVGKPAIEGPFTITRCDLSQAAAEALWR